MSNIVETKKNESGVCWYNWRLETCSILLTAGLTHLDSTTTWNTGEHCNY